MLYSACLLFECLSGLRLDGVKGNRVRIPDEPVTVNG